MIVEEQGIGFRTGVRFPSAPLFRKPCKYWGNPLFIRLSSILRGKNKKPESIKNTPFFG